jgi:NitT/TauT family transport system substrate-binding protein
VGRLGMAGAAIAAALTLATAGCGDGDTNDAGTGGRAVEKVTYLTGAGVQGREAYVYMAIEKGYFAAAGFDVQVRPGNGTNQNLQLLQSGQADFAVVDITAALIEYGRGTFTGFTVVSALHQRNLSCIAAIAGKGIAQPRDLAGKKIGYLPGGVVKALFDAYAGRAGLDASSIEWVNLPAQQLPQNLAAGTVDAATQLVVGAPAIEAAAKGQKAVVLPLSDHLPDLYGNGIAVGRAAATDQPDRVRRFNDAVLKGLADAIADPDEAGRVYAKYQKIQPPAVAAAEVRLMVPYATGGAALGALDEARMTRNVELVHGAGAMPNVVEPADVVSFDLAPKG